MKGVVRDESGAVLEELQVVANPEYDQSIVYLETQDGHQTMAALKRVR